MPDDPTDKEDWAKSNVAARCFFKWDEDNLYLLADVYDDTLHQIYTEIERLRTELISEQELALVKNIMVGEMMRILDGPFGIVDVTIENVQCGTDNLAIERSVEAIRCCTPEDVQRLAEKYLRREDLVEVTVG